MRRDRLTLVLGVLFLVVTLFVVTTKGAAGTHTCDPSDPDSDGDGLPDSCDYPTIDFDVDGFEDSLEVFVGTDPAHFCSFPPDINGDNVVNILDLLPFKQAFNTHADDPAYRARYDLNASEDINMLDALVFKPPFNTSCPFPIHPSTATADLRSGTIHNPKAQVWFSSVGNVYVDNDALDLTTCDEVKQATDHWSNLTDFQFSVGLAGNCNTTSDVRVFFRGVSRDPAFVAEVVPYDASPSECTDDAPCHFAHFAEVLLNRNNSDLTGDQAFRHVVFTHELGHVVGQGHTGGFGSCGPVVPYTVMFTPGFCWDFWGLHWVRVNDVLFTNVKY